MTNKQKQWQLYYLGYYGNSLDDIDGVIGPKTIKGTRAFQNDNGLAVDGIFGPLTEGKSKEVIAELQTALNAQIGAGLAVDGLAGKLTIEATKAYQREAGLSVDGRAGAETRPALLAKITSETPCNWSKIRYFKREEFSCTCKGEYCDSYPAEMKHILIAVADRVREHFGAPAYVSSGARCTQRNKIVGGVPNSRHLVGKAMDFRVKGIKAGELLAYVKEQPEIAYAYAIDENYVHMDIE